MLREVEAPCPGCQAKVHFDVDVPDARIQIVEDATAVARLSENLTETQESLEQSQQALDALREDLQRWQNGENHLQAGDMIRMLRSCPNCKPTWDVAVKAEREQAVKSLTLDQVKEIARAHKLWPPPTIHFAPDPLRKARP